MDDLYLVHSASGTEVPAAAVLAGEVHGPGIEALTLALVRDFPEPAEVLVAVHRPSGAVVSLLVLIPWTWQLGPACLPVLETGIVATHPDHRLRGLSRALMDLATRRRRDRGVAVSVIQGIPRYYQRLGYAYAAPLEVHDELPLGDEALPPGWSSREAGEADSSFLAEVFIAPETAPLASLRTTGHWRYRLGPGRTTATTADFRLLIDPAGRAAGAWGASREGFGEGLIVSEAGQAPGFDQAVVWTAVAADASRLARSRGKPHLRLNLGSGHPFTLWARGQGARRTGSWHWQVLFDDAQAALDAAASDWQSRWPAGPVTRLVLDLYERGTVVLTPPGSPKGVEARAQLPVQTLVQLVFGWRDPQALRTTTPDFFGSPEALAVVDALFPAREGFASSPY